MTAIEQLVKVVEDLAAALPKDRNTVKTCYAVTNDLRDAAHQALAAYRVMDAGPARAPVGKGQSDFKKRLMATGRVANFDTKGRPRANGAPDADQRPGHDPALSAEPPTMEAELERFLAWGASKNINLAHLDEAKYPRRVFADSRTHGAWIGWQASVGLI